MNKSSIAGIIALLVLVIGFGVIIYNGRPVMHLDDEATKTVEETSSAQPIEIRLDADGNATITEVAGDVAPALVVMDTAPTPAPQPASTSQPETFTMADVAAHGDKTSCWVTIGGDVYELTDWINRHPGGPERIINLCGRDATQDFTNQHGRSSKAKSMLALLKIGTLAQ